MSFKENHPKLPVEGEDPTNVLLTKAEQAERDLANAKLDKGEKRVHLLNDWYDGEKHWPRGLHVMAGEILDRLPTSAYVLGKDDNMTDILAARTRRRFADAKPVPGSDGKPATMREAGGLSFESQVTKQTAKK